ncbi:LytTR family DNA-binding domain-containing protein [Paenibacillus sp. GCM10012307]|uniref:LytTR family transcriptional regulator DNA-binding domain-containing protein n=1 Tax=Paenibacillus roseus TaxID=2798579 RepID=A0A934J4Y3_9BACL|nr:LytTR family DNA-binding domain-containing protein [Paenibacillus roseus]MBJ6361608.1 LytTR family transcriptional regulator DNA-binding domain-containing protein [Paenibacillus roseus]
MKLYVTKDPKNMGELITIDIHDVLYIENSERTVILHTSDGEYYPLLPTLSTFEHHMKQFDFHRLDRTNLVNMNKIKKFDEDRSLVFFQEQETKNGKYGTVSSNSKRVVKRKLKGHNKGGE